MNKSKKLWASLRVVPREDRILFISIGIIILSMFNHILPDELSRWVAVLWCEVTQNLLLAILIYQLLPERKEFLRVISRFYIYYIVVLRYLNYFLDIYAGDDWDWLMWSLKAIFMLTLGLVMFLINKEGNKLRRKLWMLFRL